MINYKKAIAQFGKTYKLSGSKLSVVVNMKRGVSTVLIAMVVLVVILAAVAAYGWLRPIEVPAPEAVTLEEKAQKEGKLTIYGVMDTPDFVAKVIPAFEAQYPWAKGKLEYVGFSPAECSSKSLAEYQAGNVQADVMFCTLGSFMPALQGGVAEVWTNPMISLMNYTTGTYDPENKWGPGFQLPIIVIYNTDIVAPADVPKTWEDLADPKWKGKLAVDDPKGLNVGGSLFAHLYPIMGEAAWTSLMQGIAANNPVRTQTAGEAFTKVASGDAAIGTGLINDYLAGKAQTPPIPVEIAWIKPVTSLPITTSLAKNAPHPNFAKLFSMWWISAAGQYSIANTGRIPMHIPIAAGTILAGVVPPEVTSIEGVASNNPDYYINPSKWSDKFKAIFG